MNENSGEFQNSNIFSEMKEEREEIMKHKWIESEKAGGDVGYNWALFDWIAKHKQKWKNRNKK